MSNAAFDELEADFSFLDDWEERYRYVIELGKALPALGDEDVNDGNKVQGCVSQVWLKTTISRDDAGTAHVSFTGQSDAHIVQGLIAILQRLLSGQSARHIVEIDAPAQLARLGLNDHLTPQRSNGLAAMINRIKADALAAL